ncbi:glycoside hydrolase family 5 protein [Aestuariivivens sediminis]|uniref:glycoside hydrolase family 5 protein n=1 Tax=Aestuariivivens sediminis TaxID=2913557 RepID=UPI001F58E485|nr:cellulase family glycosylhydrolase [Aestuariivivens sediminis]
MNKIKKISNIYKRPLWGVFIVMLFSCSAKSQHNPSESNALKAVGNRIANSNNETVLLKGVNLGQWLVMEGFMSGSHGGMSQSAMKRKLFDSGKSKAQIEAYFDQYRSNFITSADIDFIASKGYNCIRLPLHYELFLTDEQREKRLDVIYADGAAKEVAYNSYKSNLLSWVNHNTLASQSNIDGFKIIDQMVNWCKTNQIYIILDMHVVPGTAGDNVPITDEMMEDFSFGGRDFFADSKNREVLFRIWDKISKRYKDESTICMYDLINEPHHRPSGSLVDLTENEMSILRNSYNTMINDIRGNGDETLILLQGGDFGNDYLSSGVSIYPSDMDNRSNLVFNFHRYRADNSITAINGDKDNINLFGSAVAFSKAHNVPLFCGETGLDDNYVRLFTNLKNMSDLGFGWALWTLKTHTDRNDPNYISNRIPLDVGGNNLWDDIQQWENGTLFENIKFENCDQNAVPAFWEAISPYH